MKVGCHKAEYSIPYKCSIDCTSGSLLGAFRLCAASHFPPSLPFFGFVLCFLAYKGGFFSSNRVARLSSAYDFWCVVTPCDLLLNESCVFLAFIIRLLTPSIPAGFLMFPARSGVRSLTAGSCRARAHAHALSHPSLLHVYRARVPCELRAWRIN